MNWNSDKSFPVASGGWEFWRPPFGRKREGESKVRRATWQWHPLDPILVSVPGAVRLLPPICFQSIAPALHRKMILQYRALLALIVFMAAGFITAGAIANVPFFVKAGIAISLLFLFVFMQYTYIFRNIGRLCEYSRFVSWCYLQPQAPVLGIALLMLAVGVTQYFLQIKTGGLYHLIQKYGLVFENAQSEPWRYIVGPFLHAGLAHWIGNFSLLVVGAGMSFAIGRHITLAAIFLMGVLVPGIILTFLPHWVGLDAFLGVSGGVFAIFGWIVGVAFRRRLSFPFGLWWVVTFFAAATAIGSSLLDPRASWFAHSCGFVIGLVAGLSNIGIRFDLEGHD